MLYSVVVWPSIILLAERGLVFNCCPFAAVSCRLTSKGSFILPFKKFLLCFLQAVIVPCGLTATLPETDKIKLLNKCKELEDTLKAAGVRAKGDFRDNYSPGWKFNHWELKVFCEPFLEGLEPWLGTLCFVLGQDTLLSQCLSLCWYINGYR